MPALTGVGQRAALREQVRTHAENRPAVYRMLGPAGMVLYVGKSIRVRSRLLSYLCAPADQKASEIITHTERIAWTYVNDEFAALLEELRLIRRFRPPLNVHQKNQPGLAFLQISAQPAARVLAVAQPTPRNRGVFGPVRGRLRAAAVVRELNDLLELADCPSRVALRFADQYELFRTQPDPPRCWRAETLRCLAPCASGCTEATYHDRVALARAFLNGMSDAPLDLLRARMQAAAAGMHYEYAAQLRDRWDRLANARDEIVRLRQELASLSFLYRVDGFDGARSYVIRSGIVARAFGPVRTAAERRAAERELRRAARQPDPRLDRLDADQVAEMMLVARWFRFRPEERARTVPLPAACAGTGLGHAKRPNSASP
ncbi:MAG: nuclease [Longimicrobiales bacterium]